MNEISYQEENVAFDVLLNQLAEEATKPESEAGPFFSNVVKAIDVICSPNAVAVVGNGHDDTLLFVEGTTSAKSAISSWNLPSRLDSDQLSSKELLEWSASDGEFAAIPINTGQRIWGWLVVARSPSDNHSLVQQITSAIGEIVSEFVAFHLLTDRANHCDFLESYVKFSLNAHASFDKRPTAFAIANDVRLLTSSERVSLFQVKRNRVDLLCNSSVSATENRTQLAKKMKQLVIASLRNKVGFSTDQLPEQPRLRQMLGEFTELTGLPYSVGIPINSIEKHQRPIGFLVIEGTEQINRFEFTRGVSYSIPHVRLALKNTLQQERIPFRKFLQWTGSFLESVGFVKPLMVAAIVAGLILSLLFVQTDFRIRIEGQLRPVKERTIFAPAESIVQSIEADHGDLIATGDELLQLRSPEIEIDLEKNAGDFEKLNNLIETKKIALNQAINGGDPVLQNQLATELSDLNQQLLSLESEKRFLLERKRELRLISPMDGKVITWHAKRSLLNKPVRWGEPLIDIANEEGPWNIVFQVPEAKIGYIMTARDETKPNEPLRIDYFLESQTNERFQTRILEIGKATEFDPELGSFVRVRCDGPAESYVRRHGARVIADVYCGRKSIGYVWTQELWDGIRRRFVW